MLALVTTSRKPSKLHALRASREILEGSAAGRKSMKLIEEYRRPLNLHDEVAAAYEVLIQAGFEIDPTPMELSPNAYEVMSKRYLIKEVGTGKVLETPNEMCARVANKLASNAINYLTEEQIAKKSVEEIARDIFNLYRLYYEAIRSLSVIPAGRTLANDIHSVPNCVVLNIQDSLDDIMATLRDAALLQQAGCGIGFPLHLMRPTGAVTKASGGTSSGPISFLRVYNAAFGTIKQQNRHGANMSIMKVTHPDILEFIHCKAKEGTIRNFNISVGLTDDFMLQVVENCADPWVPTFNGETWPLRRITRDSEGVVTKIENVVMTARQVFHEIVEAAWSNGEPGCVFLDRVNQDNPLPHFGTIEASNPCGEQFLHDGDVCNLGAINAPKAFDPATGQLDVEKLKQMVRTGIMMLEDAIDTFKLPVEKVKKTSQLTRRIGLGLMGWAEYLILRNIAYDSQENLDEIRRFMSIFQAEAIATTRDLAKQRGVFPLWHESVYAKHGDERRNAFLSSAAPTGTTSMIAEVCGGIEPLFKVAYVKKNILGGQELRYVNPLLMEALKRHGLDEDQELMNEIVNKGTLHQLKDRLPSEIVRVFTTSESISPSWHVEVQARFQEHIDNAISKTCNFPQSATVQDVIDAYVRAWTLRCKGLTVYRSNSRQYEVLVSVEDAERKRKKTEGDGGGSDAAAATTAPAKPAATVVSKYRTLNCSVCETADNLVHAEGCVKCTACGWSAC